MTRELGFGLKAEAREALEAGAKVVWGARAISHGDSFDLLHDRQDCVVDESIPEDRAFAVREAFRPLLDRALKGARKRLSEISVYGDENVLHVLYENRQVKLVGNTNASYGYLYLACWPKVDCDLSAEALEAALTLSSDGMGATYVPYDGNASLGASGALRIAYAVCVGETEAVVVNRGYGKVARLSAEDGRTLVDAWAAHEVSDWEGYTLLDVTGDAHWYDVSGGRS